MEQLLNALDPIVTILLEFVFTICNIFDPTRYSSFEAAGYVAPYILLIPLALLLLGGVVSLFCRLLRGS